MSDDPNVSEHPLQAAAETARLEKAAKKATERKGSGNWSTAGIGAAAIGSAAVVAALLYLNRPKKKDGDA